MCPRYILALQTVDDATSAFRRRFRADDDRLLGYEIIDLYVLDYVVDDHGKSRLDVDRMLEELAEKAGDLRPEALLVHAGLAFDEYADEIVSVLARLSRRFSRLRIALENQPREEVAQALPRFFDHSPELQILAFRVFRRGAGRYSV